VKRNKRLILILTIAIVVISSIILTTHWRFGLVRADAGQEIDPDSLSRVVVNDSFGPGERLLFSIGYGFVTAGTATLEVVDTNTFEDRFCYKIRSETNSNSFFDTFYKVRDTIISQIDVDGIFSHYFFKALNEGSYHSRQVIDFEPENGRAIFSKDDDEVDTLKIGAFAQDILSAMYYVRTLPLEVGQTLGVETISGNEVSTLQVRVLKREKVGVPAGDFQCLVVEPLLTTTGVFKAEGEIKVWLTDDRLRMPVLMKSKVVIGSIYAELKEFRLGDLNW
jgi:hypothetical protein